MKESLKHLHNKRKNINLVIVYNKEKRCFTVMLNNKIFLTQFLLNSSNNLVSDFNFTYLSILRILYNFGLKNS